MRTVMHFYYYQQDNEVIRVMETKNGHFPNTKSSFAERYCLLHYYAYNLSHTFIVIHTLIFNRITFQKCSLCQFRAQEKYWNNVLKGTDTQGAQQDNTTTTFSIDNHCFKWMWSIDLYRHI
jgi:hypothetical protein